MPTNNKKNRRADSDSNQLKVHRVRKKFLYLFGHPKPRSILYLGHIQIDESDQQKIAQLFSGRYHLLFCAVFSETFVCGFRVHSQRQQKYAKFSTPNE